ncbi:UbiA family prenyltransferase [Gammaproteobacteria bacterium]|nr:UbiA family prenyltransferase [Gammaproteobacteria bacterium]
MPNKNKKSQVIAVDLDGTLTLTDTLYEAVLSLLRNKTYLLFLLPFWLLQGVAHLKQKVADHSELDIKKLPFNQPFIDWLNKEKLNGKKIILSTAANEKVAKAIVNHFDFFDDFIASDSETNLKSARKRDALQEKYGVEGYDYAGNSSDDLKVWAGASNAILVNASDNVLDKASKLATVTKIFSTDKAGIAVWLKALRVHQWSKNILLFVPLLAAHQIYNTHSLSLLGIAFISFSLCASSVYIVNDFLDLESDRSHPRKRFRPFASGKLSILYGVLAAPILIAASFYLGAVVGLNFLIVLLAYLVLTVTYSFVLKRLVLIDCLVLATLYTIRIVAGGVAVSLSLSFWLVAFSIFIFLSLAFVKRYAELLVQLNEGKNSAHGRGYLVSDAPLLMALGVSSGYISALVIALYLSNEKVLSLYSNPLVIWLLIPILLFWVSWVWLKSSRGEMHDDPIVFAAKDKTSLIVAVVTAIVFLFAAIGVDLS